MNEADSSAPRRGPSSWTMVPITAARDGSSFVDDVAHRMAVRIDEIARARSRGQLRLARHLSYLLHGAAAESGHGALALAAAQLTFELGHVAEEEIDARLAELGDHARCIGGSGMYRRVEAATVRPPRPTS